MGIESLHPLNLIRVNKRINNVSQYEEAIKKIRDHGIMVVGSFIFGFDEDDEGVFERTVRFCERNRVRVPIFFILTPFPGTRLYHRMEEEGRILHHDWSQYNGSNVVYKPRQLSEQALSDGYRAAFKEAYSYRSLIKRVLLPPKPRLIPELVTNLIIRRMAVRAP